MTIWGALLIVGAVLAFVGASLGYGSRRRAGLALLPMALLFFAIGIIGRAIATPALDGAVVVLAVIVAVSAISLAMLGALQAVRVESIRRLAERLLRPGFLALVVALAGFATVGGVAQQLPLVPATAVTLGAALLAASLAGRERIAELGFWALTAGWVALGALPWAHG